VPREGRGSARGEGRAPLPCSGLASVHDDPAARSAAAVAVAVSDGPGAAADARALSGPRADRPDRASSGARTRAALTPGGRPVSARRFGRALGERLADSLTGTDAVVLGLPRGGVVVAAEVATALAAPLDVLVVRKLGLPWQPELAMGAIAAVGDAVETVRTEAVLASASVREDTFATVRDEELVELRRRERAYRGDRPPAPLAGRTVVLVDDGLATGSTMRAAVVAVRRGGPAGVVVAVPVGSPSACAALAPEVDDLVCLDAPRGFRAVGQAYADFTATSDDEVRAALAPGV
jgi:predicted phosphoribosyltransferase